MRPAAYYNEIDPYAAQWLRNLIAAGHIAPGDVDERSIEDVKPDDLRNYTQCHFFAGIGVWSYALRRAGWPDDKPVWTGSCPCQPFSAAGKKGGFADERHLWPAWLHLISQCAPGIIFGEQVASKDGLSWLDLVQTDIQAASYAFAATDLCAAGVGAPHIRQRLFWVADANGMGWFGRGGGSYCNESIQSDASTRCSASCWVANYQCSGFRSPPSECIDADRFRQETTTDAGARCGACGMADTSSRWQQQNTETRKCNEYAPHGRQQDPATITGFCSDSGALQVNGFWRDADWLLCRDGKWRPVEPGTFPLAHGVAGRVGKLRAYGNAINAEVAATFISAYMECGSNV
ncbi:DNA cytosine methyltransferase [Pectobacterium carotovorum]|uniref:DNA cytosine methyltransferase n=1 Tax=Pectobacterium carotovorum TaxID=554 RepID=UPI00057E0077|nr:DNA cytosine methyltransferase [Pectobacterium carotovorum]KHT31221.1 methyltransferase [Pectobacterium carotovorum subsp. carotovorum]